MGTEYPLKALEERLLLIEDHRVQKILAKLRDDGQDIWNGRKDLRQEEEMIWKAAQQHDFSFLLHLAQALKAYCESPAGKREWMYTPYALYRTLKRAAFIIPGRDCVDFLFTLVLLHRPTPPAGSAIAESDQQRYYASLLALNQPPQDLLLAMEDAFERTEYTELLHLLAHELVWQGFTEQVPILKRLGQRMREAYHPLAWLPLHTTP